MIYFSPKDIRYFEKWADGLSKLDFLDPLLVNNARRSVERIKAYYRGDSMSDVKAKAINEMVERMQERSPAPRLTPEQLNAIDLLIFGKTDKEVAETLGIGRNTISKWYKNAFFIAELNARREELWKDAKFRLKSLVHEAVDVLSNGLRSSDEKMAITSAVHILKTVGLYGEVKDDFGPTTAERAVWDQRAEKELQIYMALRPEFIL
jgi:DNA-binding CsgD family transcriptional regulator